ncbi:MAG: polysaccharide biosynthesis C-terminal domain-containing protein [Thermoguttaceae bacterium]|nr:polysaccharide biosynthesis C-terminal domain-containing protein [Thermoguttaceae bacterium]
MSPNRFRFPHLHLHFPWGSHSKSRSTEIDMSVGPLWSKLILFSIPLALSNVLQIAFNMADLIVVGRYVGDEALAAVGSNVSLVSLLVCLIGGLTLGVGVLVSRFYGAKDDAALRETVRTSFATVGLGSLLFAAVGIVFSAPILRLMETPDDVLPLATLYLQIYFAGFPALALYNCAAAVLRAVGDARRPLYYLTVAGILNVVLNFIFVVYFGWGVAGVGVATVAASVDPAF